MKTINNITQIGGNALRVLFASVLLITPGMLAAQNRNTPDKNEELGPAGRTDEIINVMTADLSVPADRFSFFLPGHLGIYNVGGGVLSCCHPAITPFWLLPVS